MSDAAKRQPSKTPSREKGKLSMAKQRKRNLEQEQEIVRSVLDTMPGGLQQMSLLGVMKWGGV
jgi:hypothetical protein